MTHDPLPPTRAATIRDTRGQDRVLVAPSRWRRHRRALIAAAVTLALAVLLLPGLLGRLSASASVSRERLSVATVERGALVRDIAVEGRVVAATSPTLYAPAAGTVRLTVKAGSRVEQDALIGSIDSPELTSRLAQERAALQGLRLDHERARLDARQQALVAEQTLEQARIDHAAAQTEYARTQKGFELGVIAEIEVMRTQAQLQKAEIALKRAQTDRGLQAEGLRFEVDARRVAAERQQLLVDDLQRQVDLLSLRSPVAGQVGQLMVAERATVARDAPLLSVVDLSSLEVEVRVPESLARDLAPGMPAQIRGNGRDWPGVIGSVSPEVVSGEVTARVRFADGALTPDAGLRQNQRLSVRAVLDERHDVLTVARGPFVEAGGGRIAWVVTDGLAQRRAIRTGALSVDRVEILEGLHAGERIVIAGTESFGDAERIVISD